MKLNTQLRDKFNNILMLNTKNINQIYYLPLICLKVSSDTGICINITVIKWPTDNGSTTAPKYRANRV